jgi:hypothetical protein
LIVNKQNNRILFTQLDNFEGIANPLCERIPDTKIWVGSGAYVSALALYRLFGSAADAGVPGTDAIVDHLKERFTQTTQPQLQQHLQPYNFCF